MIILYKLFYLFTDIMAQWPEMWASLMETDPNAPKLGGQSSEGFNNQEMLLWVDVAGNTAQREYNEQIWAFKKELNQIWETSDIPEASDSNTIWIEWPEECINIDMTDVYQLWSQKQGNFDSEYIADLLQKWFNIEFSSEDIEWKETSRYYFTTYINWEKVTLDVLQSTWDALKDVYKDSENYLLNSTISSRIHNMFDLTPSNELNDVVKSFEWDKTLVFYLIHIYVRNILYEKGRVVPE